MQKTNWQTIKDRVEMKIGEQLDDKTFVTLANEAVADLNEIAYLVADPKKYLPQDMKMEDETYTFTIADIIAQTPSLKSRETNVVLPFKYTYGYNALSIEVEGVDRLEWKKYMDVKELKNGVNTHSEEIQLISNIDWADLANKDFEITITKLTKRMPAGSNHRNEIVIELPEEFSTMIKLEGYSDNGSVYNIQSTSINSFDYDDLEPDLKGWGHIYYTHGDKVHIFSSDNLKEIRLYFTRRMRDITDRASFSVQNIELEANFANLLTFSVAHKWLENFVGTEDSETNNMFNKYLELKNEYITKNLPKRTKKRQTHIKLI